MSATIRVIVDEALSIIGEVAGTGVQAYADDKLMKDAIRAFNLIFKKRFWEQYSGWTTVVLDGTTGKITTDAFSEVVDFEDFAAVHRDTVAVPLYKMPLSLNPSLITGTVPLYWTSLRVTDANYDGRKLQIFPITATGSLNVYARFYPLESPAIAWDWEDIMYLDKDLLVYSTAFMSLVGDALNPEAAKVAQGLMEGRYKDIQAGLANHAISLRTEPRIPNQWMTDWR